MLRRRDSMRSSKPGRHKRVEQGAENVDALGVSPAVSLSNNPRQILKKAAKRNNDGSDVGNDHSPKRRRRAFSCLSCQKLKCRCEYEAGAVGCHRCQTLRIECSLRVGKTTFQGTSSSQPNPEQSGPSVEERLRHHESALQEIKDMIRDLTSQGDPSDNGVKPNRTLPTRKERDTPHRLEADPSLEYFSNPADKGTNTAPVVVLREINEQAHRGYRKLLGHINLDLVHLQLLDEETATELIQLFLQHQGHMLFVCGAGELNQSSDTRKVSALLYSVCCLVSIVYREDICGTPVHRQVYEQIRIALGEALLASPLSLDDINAILIMSNNANTPSRHGVEYIDSWLLSGYCAQQAMLSISFSRIVHNIKHGNSTADDYNAMNLWSNICLHHLRWAATTGRPSILPDSYVNQCNILLSFYRSTMQDGMLVAEIMLYSALHQKLGQRSYLDASGDCEEFGSWKQKWNYLLVLPTSSMLRVGYHAAYLILAIRSLEETGHGLGSKAFLSPTTIHRCDDDHRQRTEVREGKDGDHLHIIACNYAMLVLQTFLEMPPFVMDLIPTCFCLCIGYCALVLAHLEESQSQVPDHVTLDLITRLDQWIRASPGKAWSFKYCKLAKEKVESRTNVGTTFSQTTKTADHGPDPTQRENRASNLSSREGSPGPHSHPTVYATEPLSMPPVQPLDPDTTYARYELNGQIAFPSMEDFFGGGFLEFAK